jgi:hypothetical protein
MDWNAIQALGEIVAAVGVVATLIYVGRQIRDNTLTAQSSAVLKCAELMHTGRGSVALNADMATVYLTALSGEPTEDEVLALRQRLLWCDISRVHEAIYFQHRTGHLPDEIWDSWQEEMRIVWTTPGGRAAVVAFDNKWLHPSFAQYLRTMQVEIGIAYTAQFRVRWMNAVLAERAELRAAMASSTSEPAELVSAGG